MNWKELGFVKVGAVTPQLKLAKVFANSEEIIRLSKQASQDGQLLTLFPELSLTGYTCEDLFHSDDLLSKIPEAINEIRKASQYLNNVIIFGTPFQSYTGRLYNVAVVVFKGEILGMIPKIHLPNYKEFYEARWFSSGRNVEQEETVYGKKVLLSPYQIFKISHMTLGVEICEDLWATIPPSSQLALNGAEVIVNLSASNELIGKKQYRVELVKQQSSRLNCAYLYASSGVMESTKDVVYSGHCLIAENGSLLAESKRFLIEEDGGCVATLDLDKLHLERRKNTTFGSEKAEFKVKIHDKFQDEKYVLSKLERKFEAQPFLPSKLSSEGKDDRLEEILTIQSTGLARRILNAKAKKLVLGLSGGLDSTLASLVALRALEQLKRPHTDLLTLSMPGFGTSYRTKSQAQDLARELGSTFEEIDITKTTKSHLKDITHQGQLDATYENAQARERTQILFDMANQVSGIVVGTGNLSELALGWCTYNGDHMSNYSVNSSIPKTLVRHLVEYASRTVDKNLAEVLIRVLETKVSPELLPTDEKGEIIQSTEDKIGPYELNDFFIFHYLRNGFKRKKIQLLALEVFTGKYEDQLILSTLDSFYKRFHQQQFKRTCLPAGPKVGTVSLSPRGDWRMPDEAEYEEE